MCLIHTSEYTSWGKPKIPPADRILMDPGHKAWKNPSDNADLGFQAVGLALRIMPLNVEGLSAATHTRRRRMCLNSWCRIARTTPLQDVRLSHASILSKWHSSFSTLNGVTIFWRGPLFFFLLLSSLRGRQNSCLALRPQIGPNALPLTNQNPTTKAKGYILLKKGERKSKKHYPSYIKE